ncbi:ribonuclease HII [Leeia sp. TBRC 13508]|uniref:Ribonuclease HII n=1 Tax=Leeia speluncae TaxID=2884804 RepID=A0ABS8D605_9NEIS|nr:ribonuclease HII [Leeia speluncae]MCB6183606.1 ribonuclease HII [Leeia speluncae]
MAYVDSLELPDLCCGVDEAGRGPLAGPVYAAAVILDPEQEIAGLADSKKLSEQKRNYLAAEIKEKSKAWCIAFATVDEIDQLNILHASMLAMARAVHGLQIQPQLALIDGNRCPKILIPAKAIVKGDALVPAISAASILAKTARDQVLLELHQKYPQYGFDAHKGYPTEKHLAAIKAYGVLDEHRRSFKPVRELLVSVKKTQDFFDF